MRLRPLALALLALGALTGCDEERTSVAADGHREPIRSENTPLPKRPKAKAGGGSDALAGATAASGRDDGRQIFDGDKARAGDPTGAAGVAAAGRGQGGARGDDLLTHKSDRYSSLRVGDVPAPYGAQGQQGRANGGSGDQKPSGPGANGQGLNQGDGAANQGGQGNAGGPSAGKQRFLFIGDSQSVGGFGQGLDEGLRKDYPNSLVETFALGGSHPMWFMPGNKVSGYSSPHTFFHYYEGNDPAKLKRDLRSCSKGRECTNMAKTPMMSSILRTDTTVVVIALGSNLLTWDQKGIWAGESVTQIAQIVKDAGKRCIWVSPAHMLGPKKLALTPDQATERLKIADEKIKERLQGMCEYIDDRLPYEGGDRVHLSGKRGREVAALVLGKIRAKVP
jgi:hypothetical protein